jgi:hypothetical protein
MVQIVVLLIVYAIFLSGTSSAAARSLGYVLLTVLAIDCVALTLLGPSPFSPSGVLATYYGWRYRGNATSALPYKVVFGAYSYTLISILAGVTSGSTAVAAAMAGLLINSALLAVVSGVECCFGWCCFIDVECLAQCTRVLDLHFRLLVNY